MNGNQDWDQVVIRKKAPTSAAAKNPTAVNAAIRAGGRLMAAASSHSWCTMQARDAWRRAAWVHAAAVSTDRTVRHPLPCMLSCSSHPRPLAVPVAGAAVETVKKQGMGNAAAARGPIKSAGELH